MGREKQVIGLGQKDSQCIGSASPTSIKRDMNFETSVSDPLEIRVSLTLFHDILLPRVHPKALILPT